MEISHEEFITILDEKDKYEKTKDNLRSENKKYNVMRLSSIKSVFEYFMPSKNNFFSCVSMKWLILALKHGIKLKSL